MRTATGHQARATHHIVYKDAVGAWAAHLSLFVGATGRAEIPAGPRGDPFFVNIRSFNPVDHGKTPADARL